MDAEFKNNFFSKTNASTTKSLHTPPGWGDDELTQFLELATKNGYATHVHEKFFWPRLRHVDTVYYRIALDIMNTPNQFDAIYSIFYFRAHSIWRSAIRLAISGQNPETHILLRSCLENALYAFFIFNDKIDSANEDSRFSIWMDREENPKKFKKCRNTFMTGDIIRELEQKDQELGEIAKKIYDQTISYGAHPNVHGTLGNTSWSTEKKENGTDTHIVSHYMNCGSDAFNFALKMTCQSGLCVLLIFKIIFSERFNILGASDEIEKLKKAYDW